MLQAVLVSPGRIELKEVPEPEPGPGEVVIRVSSALSCGTDLKAYLRGHHLIPMPGPFGHEYSGTVAKVGPGVNGFREGDPVMGVHTAPCNQCKYCRKGLFNLCESLMREMVLGSYAEYLLLKAPVVRQNLFIKPSGVPFTEAGLLEPLSCVVHPYQKIQFQGIENALVLGAGPIGLLHLLFLRSRGIEVVVFDKNTLRLSHATELGARASLRPNEAQDAIEEYTDGMGFDLVVECTGNPEVWQSAVEYCRKGGMVVLFGGCKAGTTVTYRTERLHYDEITLMGSFHFTPQDVRVAVDLISQRSLPLSSLITEVYPLRQIHRVFELLSEGRGIKYSLEP